jgi:hypothetical protein
MADEAMEHARTSGDDFTVAMTALARAMAAEGADELRERVEVADSLLEAVGNRHQRAGLLASAAFMALTKESDRHARELLDRAVPLAREVDSPFLWMLVYGNLGMVELLAGDAGAAAVAFRDEVRLVRELVVLPFTSEALSGLAAVAAADGDDARAARLHGASAAHRYGEPMTILDARLDAAFFAPARVRFGAEPWEATARDGAALSFEDALAYALEEPALSLRRRP